MIHLTLFCWWGFGQVFSRVAPRFGAFDPTFSFGVVSLSLIAATLVVMLRFARALGGTPAERFARLAVALAIVDVVGEAMQFAPQLGLPVLMPEAKSSTELVVRVIWVSCEFGLRAATFVALWRSQSGADRRLPLVFFALVGAQWLLSLLAFAAATAAFGATLSALPGWGLARRAATWLCFPWMGILIWMSRRVAWGLTRPRS